MFRKLIFVVLLAALLLTACQSTPQPSAQPVPVEQDEILQPAPVEVDPTAAPTSTPASPTASATTPPVVVPTAASTTLPVTSGPELYPAGINPLTGLPVENAANLSAPPALVSVTNFPLEARPQAGLSYSPVVHELYIGEGTTRFLAMFHGDFPKAAVEQNQPADAHVMSDNAEIGPVRSGRLPYEHLRKLYNGFLVMASADPKVGATLNQSTNVFGSDGGNINSAMINVNRLEEIAQKTAKTTGPVDLQGQKFDPAQPAGGKPANSVWIPYALLDQVIWRYNAADNAYRRTQDQADGKTFKEATDRLNGEPLTYENVVVLFATHHAYAETLIDVDLLGIKKMPALLFRGGQMYNIFWTTANGEYERKTGKYRPIRFIDEQGNPFPLQPGQTWIHILPPYNPVYETVDSEAYLDKVESKATPGSGNWAVRFYAPAIEPKPTSTPEK